MPKTRSNIVLCFALCSYLLSLVWTPTVAGAASGTGGLIIFHTNDMHARVRPDEDRGASIGLP
jgi:2',3'-cyclic-nucleotide 2'-phosphodiesterase (5'-nucleotidase family)